MTDGVRTTDPSRAEQVLAGLAIAGASVLMLAAMGRPVILLVVALGVSYAIWLPRSSWPLSRRILPVLIVAVLVQCLHLGEELWSGFYRAFPPVMGSEPWSARRFLMFNGAWLGVFVLAGVGIMRGWRPAYLATLFLAIGGGIGNGLGHIALAIRANGYFPGLYTAPFALAIGIALLERHRRRVERVPAM